MLLAFLKKGIITYIRVNTFCFACTREQLIKTLVKMKTKKQQTKQKIIATFIILFMFIMIFGSVSVDFTSAIGTNTTLIQNLIAGALSMEAPATIGFNNINIGSAINSLANMTVVNARDYRGSGAAWGVTGTMNDMRATNAGINTISNSVIAWTPGPAFSDNGSNTGTAIGAAGYFSAARTLFNTSVNNGMGNYKITNTTLNVVYNGATDIVAGTFQNTLTMIIQ
jgi:hypothetical protein